MALQLVEQAIEDGIPFPAVVADSFYGEDRGFRSGLRGLKVPYVLALKPSHAWWPPEEVAGTLQDVAHEAGWQSAKLPGKWVSITRTIRSGSTQDWGALSIVAGPYGPDKQERASVSTTDPHHLPDATTWYLVTNLSAPTQDPGTEPASTPASLEEVMRLYGLRRWMEQSDIQVKHAASLVAVSGEKRPSHPTAVATRLLRLLVLLGSSQSPRRWHHASHSRASGARPPKRFCCISEGKGMRPQVSWPKARRSVGGWLEPWIRLKRDFHGWSQQPPPASRCRFFSAGLNEGMPFLSLVQLDSCPQSTGKRLGIGAGKTCQRLREAIAEEYRQGYC